MKIVYMGTPDFSVGALEALLQAGHEITAVVTQPDKPKGRGKEMQFSPVKECAIKHGIPVFQPVRIKRAEAVEQLRSFPADVYVVAAFGQMLSKEILEIPAYGSLNIHASLLPKYRGSSPIQQAVIDGEEKTGITIMQMNEGMDTGDILYKKELRLDKKETGESLFHRLAVLGAEAIVEALVILEEDKIIPMVQEEGKATYVKMIQKSDGLISWNDPAENIERLIRGMNSWPSAYTRWRGKQLKLWEADVVSGSLEAMKPGMVCEVTRDTICVACGEGILEIHQVQLEGKKRMSTRDFLLGYKIEQGELLGE